MAVGDHLRLYASSRPWKKIFKPLAPSMAYLCHTKKYTQRRDSEERERAPSTAEEFRRVAEEKSKETEEEKLEEAEQGVASRVSGKTYDGTGEASVGDGNLESVEKREENADNRRRG